MESDASRTPLSTFDLMIGDKVSKLRIFTADLTRSAESYDVVVCSAFRRDYLPLRRTLIGALFANRSISVEDLARHPEIDQRLQGCWLSGELQGSIRRIACIELLDRAALRDMQRIGLQDPGVTTLLKSSFLTLRHLLETADDRGIPVRSIAMPVLGAGNQHIDMEYTAIPLFNQCMNMLRTIGPLTTIDFYELNSDRAKKLNDVLLTMIPRVDRLDPEVFISYSSRQTDRAHGLQNALVADGLSVWIAPEGIPAGSNYLTEIPSAISKSRAVVIMLTPDAMLSPWVRREISSAIGAGKPVIPAQLSTFDLNQEFSFLLDGVQILPVWSCAGPQQDAMILTQVREKARI